MLATIHGSNERRAATRQAVACNRVATQAMAQSARLPRCSPALPSANVSKLRQTSLHTSAADLCRLLIGINDRILRRVQSRTSQQVSEAERSANAKICFRIPRSALCCSGAFPSCPHKYICLAFRKVCGARRTCNIEMNYACAPGCVARQVPLSAAHMP